MVTAKSTKTVSEFLPKEIEGIFQETCQMVYRTAHGITGSAEDAEDILQTVFLRLLRRGSTRDLLKNPRAYLYRAAVNLSLDIIQQRKREILTDDTERFQTAVSDDSDRLEELHAHLYAAVARLDPDSADILVLRYVHNYSDAEIAKLLGKSRGLIAIRLFRLRSRLRKIIYSLQGESS